MHFIICTLQTYFNIELHQNMLLDFSIHNNSLIEQSSDCNQPLIQGHFFYLTNKAAIKNAMNFKNAVHLLGFWTCSSVCRAWQPCNAIAGRWRVNNPNGWAVFFFVERADFNYTLRNYLAHYKWLWQFISNGVGHWARYIMSTFLPNTLSPWDSYCYVPTHARHYHNEPNGSSDKRQYTHNSRNRI
jgi:hypothetical protein